MYAKEILIFAKEYNVERTCKNNDDIFVTRKFETRKFETRKFETRKFETRKIYALWFQTRKKTHVDHFTRL